MIERPLFDKEATEAIRRDLLALKLASGKGAPYFADRISEVNCRKVTINQRRLSRFIAGEVEKPGDEFLGWCDVYLKSLPAPPDPVFRLAQGLLAFCEATPGTDYAGHYWLTTLDMEKKEPNPYPTSELKIKPDSGFWRVEERFLHRHRISDGALISTRGYGLMITKDRLTQITQLCTISKETEHLIGYTVSVNQEGASARSCFRLDSSDV